MADEEKKEKGIRLNYNPSDEEKEKIKHVYNRLEDMKMSPDRQKAQKKWDEAERQWEAYREPKAADRWQSNHYVPLTTSIVETALAEMVDQTERPLILPRSSEDAPKAQVMKHIFEYSWEVADGDTQLYNIMKDFLVYGTAIGQEYYLQDARTIKRLKPKKKGKEFEEVEEEVLDYDDCMLEVVKLQDFYVDENARGFDGPYAARDCIRRYIMNIDDFKAFYTGDVWNPLDNAKYVEPGGDVNYYEFFKPPEGIDMSKKVEVLHYWNKRTDTFRVVANDVLVREGPNPYHHKQLPFARAVDLKRVHSFYGKGQADLLESIQDEMNTLRRMILDRNHLDIDKMFLMSDTLNLNDDDLIARPHGMIPVSGDINSAKPIEYGDIPRSVELSLNNLNEDAITVTGIDPRAASQPQPRTATEAALLKETALKKIRMKLRLLEREFLIRVARLRVSNIIQFYSQPMLEEIVGEKGTEEYTAEVERLKAEGSLVEEDNQFYEESYRKIRIEGKRLDLDTQGNPIEIPENGIHFFEALPDLFVPFSRAGFDIKIAAGATVPLSKPLQQTKVTEMYDRLIQLALGGVGYDPVKLGDELLKVNDFDPEDFKIQEQESSASEGFTDERMQELLELANQENELMMQEQPIPPTAYSAPFHTQIHLEFMNSDVFQDLPNESPIVQIFTTHVTGEIEAQNQRGGTTGMEEGMSPVSTNGNIPSFQGQGQQNNPSQAGGNTTNTLKQLVPGMVQGGADVPVGI